jgi:hypothetical protein
MSFPATPDAPGPEAILQHQSLLRGADDRSREGNIRVAQPATIGVGRWARNTSIVIARRAGSAWAGRNILTTGITISELALPRPTGDITDDSPGRAADRRANRRTSDIVRDSAADDCASCSTDAGALLSRRATSKRESFQKAQHRLLHRSPPM